jgi:subtilisin family serine protease
VGTAPEASFYLLLSEDGASEFPVEEDNWCAAVEYADSLGCDIITSSLGYHQFDDKSMSHKYYELNGHTAINSRSASLAASRGILLLNSAGNSGTSPWKKIGCPADAENILAVGAVRGDSLNTNFSSLGNSADGRVKPDVMAMGYASRLVMPDGTLGQANGTSFACPIMCGGVACLLQAFPDRRPEEIMESVRKSGNNATHPDNVFGYGIPNLWKAYEKLSGKKK